MLTEQQKIAVRRHLGIPFAGTAQAGRLFGRRFEIHVEDLEYMMLNMQPSEEQLLIGVSMGSYRIGGQPTVGDVLSYTINGTTVEYTVQESDFETPPNPINPAIASPLFRIALNSAKAILANATLAAAGITAVGVQPGSLFSPQYMPPYSAQVQVSGPSATAIVCSGSVSGTTAFYCDNPGTQCPIVGTFIDSITGAQSTTYGLIAMCDYLANTMTQASSSLRLSEAGGAGGAGVKYRIDEIRARKALYKEYVMQMARALGGEKYVRKFSGKGGRGAVA